MKQKKNQEVHSQVIKLKRFFLTVKYFFQLKRREIYWIITSDVADSLKTIFKYVVIITIFNSFILCVGAGEFYALSFFNLRSASESFFGPFFQDTGDVHYGTSRGDLTNPKRRF